MIVVCVGWDFLLFCSWKISMQSWSGSFIHGVSMWSEDWETPREIRSATPSETLHSVSTSGSCSSSSLSQYTHISSTSISHPLAICCCVVGLELRSHPIDSSTRIQTMQYNRLAYNSHTNNTIQPTRIQLAYKQCNTTDSHTTGIQAIQYNRLAYNSHTYKL